MAKLPRCEFWNGLIKREPLSTWGDAGGDTILKLVGCVRIIEYTEVGMFRGFEGWYCTTSVGATWERIRNRTSVFTWSWCDLESIFMAIFSRGKSSNLGLWYWVIGFPGCSQEWLILARDWGSWSININVWTKWPVRSEMILFEPSLKVEWALVYHKLHWIRRKFPHLLFRKKIRWGPAH